MVRPRPAPPVRLAGLLAAVALGGFAASAATARAAPPGRQVIVGVRAPGAPRAQTSGPGAGALAPRSGRVHARVITLARGERVAAGLRRLRRRPGIAWALPDYRARAAGGFYPDDPGRSGRPQGWQRMQWNLLPGTGVDAPQAWANLLADHRAGGRGVRIAVLDTGVAYRDWQGFRESPDLRGTRFVDPYDFVADDRYPLDRDGHGTFVASVLAEATNNGIGLTGLAYGSSIMPVRVLGSDEEGAESTIAEGIRYAVLHHAQIINLSLEFVPDQVRSARQIPLIVSAVEFARRHGVMVVAAAGNDETRVLSYPARLPGVVSVGATTRDGCLANYSDTGPGLDLVAPGGGEDAILPQESDCHPGRSLPPIYQLTLSDPPDGARFGYPDHYVGTSMAAPEVAGAAALVIASGVLGPDPTPDQVLARLEHTATPLPFGATGPDDRYGYGLLDAGAATAPLAVASRDAPPRGWGLRPVG